MEAIRVGRKHLGGVLPSRREAIAALAGLPALAAFLEACGPGAAKEPRFEGEIVGGSSGVGHRLLAGDLWQRPVARTERVTVAILGGGIAGLSAALTLSDAGIGATVYESSDRVGGRMYTDRSGYWANGQISEWGGELIDQGHKTILSLAQRFRLDVTSLAAAEVNGSEPTFFFDGAYYPKADADRDFQAVHNALQGDVQAASYPTTWDTQTDGGRFLDAHSVYEWIELRVPGGHASPMGQLLDAAYNIEYGAETTDQSALNLVYLLGYGAKPGNFQVFGASNEKYHIDGGNERLPQAIAQALDARQPGTIRTGMRLASIAQSGGAYSLVFTRAGGTTTITADRVILALPFAVLRTLDYRKAGFDDLKKLAVASLGAGRNAKLQLQFGTRFWNGTGAWPGVSNGETYADTGYQNTWEVSRGQLGLSGILVDYTGGDVAGRFKASAPFTTVATNSGVAKYAGTFLRQIELVLPGATARWNGRASLSIPFADPNFNLAYSYWRVGQYTTIAGYEGVRQGRVHFAGEHTAVDFQGYMEGGAITGVRAANEILDDLKRGL